MKSTQKILFILFILSTVTFADVPRTLYTINASAETISKMDLNSKMITQNIATTGQMPNKILAFDDMIYILDSGTSDIKMLNPGTDQIVRTIVLTPGANPWDMEFVGVDRVYVSNWVANTVSVVDLSTGSIIKDITVGKGPEDILILDNLAFVTNTGYAGWGLPYEQGTVMIIDISADRIIDTIAVPTNPQKVVLAPDGRVHVLCTGDYVEHAGRVAVIDLQSGQMQNKPAVIDTIELGGAPGDLDITSDGKAYAIDWGDGLNGFLYAYNAVDGTVWHDSDNPLKVGPNTGQVLYDEHEECLWIPYMKEWGGDGYVQKFDVAMDSVVWISDVIGNGTQKITILESVTTNAADGADHSAPNTFLLLPNYPNPFNPATTIRFDLSSSNIVSVDIFNASGQLIKTLMNQPMGAGQHSVQWDGMDKSGQAAASGTYLARVKVGGEMKSLRMVLAR
ncbi:T9SS type A sorting domain-containing protein [candidate division KSB1 bacterium]|nr:T9SS type A sorting domain-containing protein [candidate division KSB1 bacterium]